jgi:hypothetical protein
MSSEITIGERSFVIALNVPPLGAISKLCSPIGEFAGDLISR